MQRYDTVGDWTAASSPVNESTIVRVSRLADRRFEILVAVHELIEAELCRARDIKEHDVTAFDEQFERQRHREIEHLERELGRAMSRAHTRAEIAALQRQLRDIQTAEPGDSPDAPYHKEHVFATKIERLLAKEFDVDWREYEAAINSLEWRKEAAK